MLFDKLVEQFKKKKIRIIKSRNFFVYFVVAHASLASDRTQSSLIVPFTFFQRNCFETYVSNRNSRTSFEKNEGNERYEKKI